MREVGKEGGSERWREIGKEGGSERGRMRCIPLERESILLRYK